MASMSATARSPASRWQTRTDLGLRRRKRSSTEKPDRKPGATHTWQFSCVTSLADDVRSLEQSGLDPKTPTLPFLTQAVWKRFPYPNNCKQPGVMDLDATV